MQWSCSQDDELLSQFRSLLGWKTLPPAAKDARFSSELTKKAAGTVLRVDTAALPPAPAIPSSAAAEVQLSQQLPSQGSWYPMGVFRDGSELEITRRIQGGSLGPKNTSEPWSDRGPDGGEGGKSAQHHQVRSRGRNCLLTQR